MDSNEDNVNIDADDAEVIDAPTEEGETTTPTETQSEPAGDDEGASPAEE